MIEVMFVDVGPRCVREFPHGSDMITDVLAAGVEIELSLAMILGVLSGSDPQAAAIVLRQMRSVADQEKAVLNVARARLAPEAYTTTKIASKAIEGHRKRRNRFAHNPWASSPEVPGAIFLIEATALAHYLTGISGTMQSESSVPFKIHESDVYRAADVQRAREEARDAAAVMRALVGYVAVCYRPDLTGGGVSAATALANLRAIGLFAAAEKEFWSRSERRRH